MGVLFTDNCSFDEVQQREREDRVRMVLQVDGFALVEADTLGTTAHRTSYLSTQICRFLHVTLRLLGLPSVNLDRNGYAEYMFA